MHRVVLDGLDPEAMVAWTGVTGGNSGVYLQGFQRDGTLAHPNPIRADSEPVGTVLEHVSLAAYDDGSVAVAWLGTQATTVVRAQRVDTGGASLWPGDVPVYFFMGTTPSDPAIEVQGSDLFVAFIRDINSSPTQIGLMGVDSGGNVLGFGSVTGSHESIDRLAMAPFAVALGKSTPPKSGTSMLPM